MNDGAAKIVLGGESLEWGEDDLWDFLSQYGVVEKMTRQKYDSDSAYADTALNGVYLSAAGRRHRDRPYLLVVRTCHHWSFFCYSRAGLMKSCANEDGKDLLPVLRDYLKLAEGESDDARAVGPGAG